MCRAELAPLAVPALVEAMKDANPQPPPGAAAAPAPGKGPQAKSGMSVLIAALQDRDDGLRQKVAMALGKLGVRAKAAVPALARGPQRLRRKRPPQCRAGLQAIDPDAVPKAGSP